MSTPIIRVEHSNPASRVGLAIVSVAVVALAAAPMWADRASLKPVMTWKTGIIHLKQVSTGTPISYGSTWKAARPSLIATLPLGYADGYWYLAMEHVDGVNLSALVRQQVRVSTEADIFPAPRWAKHFEHDHVDLIRLQY